MFKVKSFDKNHPNPIFYRKDYTILNGTWNFYMDYNNKGEKLKFNEGLPVRKLKKIEVPFSYLTLNSGINKTKRCDNVWYERTYYLNTKEEGNYFLHFEGSDYKTKVWVNSKYVGEDIGAYHRLTFDITDMLIEGENVITIKCEDSNSTSQPRGKQRWTRKNFMCWYEETTGIFKDVWIEHTPSQYIKSLKITPDRQSKQVSFSMDLVGTLKSLNLEVSYKNEVVFSKNLRIDSRPFVYVLELPNIEEWNVLDPKLYDVKIKYADDEVLSYFAFRSLQAQNSKVFINGKSVYQKLVLDQGYFDGGDLTPKSPDDLYNDIKNAILMGFNGCRKHQKREDDRFYTYADMMGFLVWAEMPSGYKPSKKMFNALFKEWSLIVDELYNHPSIICWTPINESWGVYKIHTKKIEQDFVNNLYDYTKEVDPSRFCLTNDGWEHTKSDFLTIHLYDQDFITFKDNILNAIHDGNVKTLLPFKYYTFAKGYKYQGQPILIDEFGGISFTQKNKGWGYGKAAKSSDEYIRRIEGLYKVLSEIPEVQGYCYTQLTDVKQEINGLYTMDRLPKIDPKVMNKIQNNEK